MSGLYSDFAYDDAFRTIESECDDLLIAFVNYIHGESYGRDAKVIRGRNEHFIEYPDKSDAKRITDSFFEVDYMGRRNKYHYECESGRYDDTLLIRIFEYDTQIALDTAEVNNKCLMVDFPYSGLLLLRGTETFDSSEVIIRTPGGTVKYPIAVMRMKDINLETIFSRQLYFLLPFYMFNYEGRLERIDSDSNELDRFADMYKGIIDRLERDVEKQFLSQHSFHVIIRLINKVSYKLNMNHRNVQKKVGDIMGGKVLDLDVIVAKREGRAEGLAEGKRESILLLADSYMKENPSLSREEAIMMATSILDPSVAVLK